MKFRLKTKKTDMRVSLKCKCKKGDNDNEKRLYYNKRCLEEIYRE